MFEKQTALNLRNHVSLWLEMAALIETGLINDLEETNIAMNEDCKTIEFVFEKSLEILLKFLRKLVSWPNETIYLFYFYILNLYYSH